MLRNKMVLGATVGVVGGLVVSVLLVVVLGMGRAPTPAAAEAGATPRPAASPTVAFGPSYEIQDEIVNLADPGGRRYLRYSVALEFAPKPEDGAAAANAKGDPQKAFLARIQKYTPALQDAVTTVLSSKTSDEMGSAEGKDAAKQEIKGRCQRIVGTDETIANVYFTELVIQ